MYFTSGANVSTIRLRSWGSFVSRYFFHSARVSSWEMRFLLLGSSFIGGPRAPWGRGGSRLDRPLGRRPLATLHRLRASQGFSPPADDCGDPSPPGGPLHGTSPVPPRRRLTQRQRPCG